MVQLLQSTTRLLECPWLQQQHRSAVEACIRTLAMVGKDLPQGRLCPSQGIPHPWAPLPQQPTRATFTRREAPPGMGMLGSGMCWF